MKSGNKNSKSNHNSSTPTEIAKEALDLGKNLIFLLSVMRLQRLEELEEA